MTRTELIAKRKFHGVTWTLERVYWNPGHVGKCYLTEHGGQYRADSPIRYHTTGLVAYDRPEWLPKEVREWCERKMPWTHT